MKAKVIGRSRVGLLLGSVFLVLALSDAWAVDSVFVESKSIVAGRSGQVGIFLENDEWLNGVYIPLVIREVDPGSYMTSLTMVDDPPGARIIGYLDLIHVMNTYPTQNATSCGIGFAGFGYDPLDYVSPDGILFQRESASPPTPLLPGTDFGGNPSFRLDLVVNNTPGRFEIDTTCIDPNDHLLYILTAGGGVTPSFTKGIITITPCGCPSQSDMDGDGLITAVDLADVIDIVYFGGGDSQDPNCPRTRGDFDCDGTTSALDLTDVIDYVYFNGPGPCDPCL